MEAQLRSYLNDHATAWWVYMKKGEWAEQIGSFTRDALYITIMFILIPTAALMLYSLLVMGGFLGKGFSLIAEQEKNKKEGSENKLSFFAVMSQWFGNQSPNGYTSQTIPEVTQGSTEGSQGSSTTQVNLVQAGLEDTLTPKSTTSTSCYNPNNLQQTIVDNSLENENTNSLNKEVGLYQTTPELVHGSLKSQAAAVGVELYGTLNSQSSVYSTNKVDEDAPF